MTSRTIREGSVGLLILVGVGLFVGIILWLTGTQVGKRSYNFIVEFNNANGMKVGSVVIYRGVSVGRITSISTSTNGVEVIVEIGQSNLVIGRDSAIEVNQSGLIGETSVAITPITNLSPETLSLDPLAANCNNQLIICNGSRIAGDVGVSFNQLLRGTQRVSSLYSSPEFFENINTLIKNASEAATGVTKLTREFSTITGDVKSFTANANSLTNDTSRTLTQIGDAATITSAIAARTALQIGNTADQYGATGVQLNQLLTDVSSLVLENRGTLVTTLNDLSLTSSQLRTTVGGLSPALDQFTSGQILQNLETLSVNAAEASRNLREVSGAVNNPATLVALQQTLDSARVSFNNVQKITADLDELTGDPQFRNNLRQLVNGLGNLVSSSEQIQQQLQVAQQLEQLTPANVPTPLANSSTPATPALTPPTPMATPVPLIQEVPRQLANNYQVLPRQELNLPTSLDRTP